MTTRLTLITVFALCAFFALCSCTPKKEAVNFPLLGKEPVKDVRIHESGAEAVKQWAQDGLNAEALIHIGASSGIAGIGRTHIREAAKRNIVSEVYWVVPQPLFDDIPLAEPGAKVFLIDNGFEASSVNKMYMRDGCLEGWLEKLRLHVCAPNTLPTIRTPVVLMLDADAFPAFSESSGMNKLWCVKTLFDMLSRKEIRVKKADIIYGVRDGLTLPIHAYLADEAAEIMAGPAILASAPPDIWRVRDIADDFFIAGEHEQALNYIASEGASFSDDPALSLIKAAALAGMKRYDEAHAIALDACRAGHKASCYGLDYLGRLAEEGGDKKAAEKFRASAGKNTETK